MRKLIIILFLLCSTAHADEIKIPFSCYPKAVQAKLKESGYKLDLDRNERTYESWGFLENKGSEFSIFTYHALSKKDFELLLDIMNRDWEQEALKYDGKEDKKE